MSEQSVTVESVTVDGLATRERGGIEVKGQVRFTWLFVITTAYIQWFVSRPEHSQYIARSLLHPLKKRRLAGKSKSRDSVLPPTCPITVKFRLSPIASETHWFSKLTDAIDSDLIQFDRCYLALYRVCTNLPESLSVDRSAELSIEARSTWNIRKRENYN